MFRNRLAVGGAVALAAALALTVRGVPAHAEGGEIAVRAGLGLPLGDVDAPRTIYGNSVDDPLSWTASLVVPIGFEMGARAWRSWYFGGSFTYAPGSLGDPLHNQCSDCSVTDVRVGADARYHFLPERRWDPWLGGGFGYEWLHIGTPNDDLSASGFEFVRLEAGLDWNVRSSNVRADRSVASLTSRFGPFVELTVAQYDWRTVFPSSNRFVDTARHGWLMFGLRFSLDTASHVEPAGASESGAAR